MDRNASDDAPKVEHFELLRAEIARKANVKQEKESHSTLQRTGMTRKGKTNFYFLESFFVVKCVQGPRSMSSPLRS